MPLSRLATPYKVAGALALAATALMWMPGGFARAQTKLTARYTCLLYTSDAADE